MTPSTTRAKDFRLFVSEKLISRRIHIDTARKNFSAMSAVLMPLKQDRKDQFGMLLTRRSDRVTQPGDYCFPGGHVNFPADNMAAAVLSAGMLSFYLGGNNFYYSGFS